MVAATAKSTPPGLGLGGALKFATPDRKLQPPRYSAHPWRDQGFPPRFQRMVQHLHDLGSRPLAEFLIEIAGDEEIRNRIETCLERYYSLDEDLVQALGWSGFPQPPICKVPR